MIWIVVLLLLMRKLCKIYKHVRILIALILKDFVNNTVSNNMLCSNNTEILVRENIIYIVEHKVKFDQAELGHPC